MANLIWVKSGVNKSITSFWKKKLKGLDNYLRYGKYFNWVIIQ